MKYVFLGLQCLVISACLQGSESTRAAVGNSMLFHRLRQHIATCQNEITRLSQEARDLRSAGDDERGVETAETMQRLHHELDACHIQLMGMVLPTR